MHSEQSTFDFTPPAPPFPGEVEELVRFLHTNPGFHTARAIGEFMNLSDRKIRQLAEAANGLIVSGPGAPGYIHLHHCPTDQLAHIAESLISQGKAMIQRGIKTRNLAHRTIR